jgi:ubiquinol-cytochrome c reductase cytochrome b subunit
LILFFVYFWVIFFNPNWLGHSDNYIPADSILTPAHIVPEWYFLPFYAILRSIPNKLGGVAAMGLSIASLLALPFLDFSKVDSPKFRPIYKVLY